MTGVAQGTNHTPASLTMRELQSDCLGFVKMPDDAEAQATAAEAVNAAIRRLSIWRWRWALTAYVFNAQTNANEFNLPGNFKSPFSLERLDANDDRIAWEPIPYRSPREFIENNPSIFSGEVTEYTVFNATSTGVLTLNRKMSQSFVTTSPRMRLRYYRRVDTLTQRGGVLDAPPEVVEFVRWYAREELATHFRPELVNLAGARQRELWRELRADDEESQNSDWRD